MRITDEEIIAAMLTHSTNRKAAEAVRLSDRAFYNRIRKPSFQAKLAEEKARILDCRKRRQRPYKRCCSSYGASHGRRGKRARRANTGR